jgi:hypothetical protein
MYFVLCTDRLQLEISEKRMRMWILSALVGLVGVPRVAPTYQTVRPGPTCALLTLTLATSTSFTIHRPASIHTLAQGILKREPICPDLCRRETNSPPFINSFRPQDLSNCLIDLGEQSTQLLWESGT